MKITPLLALASTLLFTTTADDKVTDAGSTAEIAKIAEIEILLFICVLSALCG